MGLDQLLELTSSVSSRVLPILGVIALVFLIIFLKRLVNLMLTANKAVERMEETLTTANKQLEALDKPLNTINELSDTVDSVHEASKQAVKSALVAIIENFSTIKDWAFSMKKGKDEEDYEASQQTNVNRSVQDESDE